MVHALFRICLLTALTGAVPGVALAQTLVRGPYLQRATPTSLVVRWRSDAPTPSRVRYGTSPGALSSTADVASATTEHRVVLSGLSPNTTYYYTIGAPTLTLAGGDDYFFVTPPQAGSAAPTRVLVLGDSGTATANAAAVRDAYLRFTASRHTDVWLMLGDNAYSNGTDAEYQRAVFDMYPQLLRRTALWPTFGNHDAVSADSATLTGVYYDTFSLPRSGEAGGVPSGTEAYYSFNHANIHFVCLDSSDSSRAPASPMLTWLEQDLTANALPWVIAYWHHPPYSRGSHNSDTEPELVEMRQHVLPILEAHGVDLVLSGHSHAYERSWPIDGHYGVSTTFDPTMKKGTGLGRVEGDGAYEKPAGHAAHSGTVYVVAGTSGQVSGGALDHAAMPVAFSRLGALVLDVTDSRLDAAFVDSEGVTRDSFTIHKGLPDADGDTLPDAWEQTFGLDSTVSNAHLDSDGDGRSNLEELGDHTHPMATSTRHFAEGATGSFFSTQLTLFNPDLTPQAVLLRFNRKDGATHTRLERLDGMTRRRIEVGVLDGLEAAEFGTIIESNGTLVADRTMRWDTRGYGGHSEGGLPSLSTRWYLAEGSTAGQFALFYLVENPHLTDAAAVRVTYLLPHGPPVVRTYSAPPHSRITIWVNQVPELASTDVSAIIEVTNGVPVAVERAMYLSTATRPLEAGHGAAAIPAAATTWFLAEGATGPFFDEFVLVANPGTSTASVEATYFVSGGAPLVKQYTVAPMSRLTIWVDQESFPGLGQVLTNAAVSIRLRSLNAVPIVVERAMWWPGPTPATWAEAHVSGATAGTALRWGVAEGHVGGPTNAQTFMLIANPNQAFATARVTVVLEDGSILSRTFTVPATSRFTVSAAAEFPAVSSHRFSAVVDSLGPDAQGLVVEVARYWDAAGAPWAAGTSLMATPLP